MSHTASGPLTDNTHVGYSDHCHRRDDYKVLKYLIHVLVHALLASPAHYKTIDGQS